MPNGLMTVTFPVDPSRYFVYLGVMAVMAVTPGPANLFAIATGVGRGKRATLSAVGGMNAATLVWFAGAALGLGTLVAAFPKAFHWLALAGAAYVAWLGVKSIYDAILPTEAGVAPVFLARSGHPFRGGFAVQIANPKALLFFTAVLPSFIDVHRPIWLQLVMFAAATLALDVISMTAYGFSGAALADRMRAPGFRKAFAWGVGVLLIGAAILIYLRS